MQRVNLTVSDEAKEVLLKYQKMHQYNRQDDALDALLMEYEHMKEPHSECTSMGGFHD
jgi:hypothetical protein